MEDEHQNLEYCPIAVARSVLVGTCTNHHRFAILTHLECQEHCGICTNQVLEIGKLLTKAFCFSGPSTKETIPGRNLTCMSKGVLEMITNCLLTMSLALGLSEQDDIRDVLHVVGKDDIGTYLYMQIESTLRNLEVQTGLKQTELDYFLYILIERVQDLWKDHLYFLNESERNDWEIDFTKTVGVVIQEIFTVIRKAKKQIMALHGLDESAVEYKIQEIDKVGWLPCLFRLTREPSLENLSFDLYERNKADSFPFVALVLRTLPQLHLIKHIRPLISWHKACVMYLSYRKKKADCKKPDYTVSLFLKEEVEEKRRDALKTKFESFRMAWEEIRENTEVKGFPKMERIHIGSKLENSLMLDKSTPMYRVLEILVSMQNNFLDETLALAVERYVPALDFLQKNTKKSSIACFPCVPVTDARLSDLITFEWTDNYLQFSQCNLQYGHGRDISYDCRTIEMELANTLLLGKSYLLLKETFPVIIFTDERYKTYVHMIQELKNAIPQKKLPIGIEKELHDKKENPKQIADLLNCLGIVMSLLRRTRGRPDTPVAEAIGDWNQFFSKEVCQTFKNDLCLCHIVEMNGMLEELNAGGIIEDLDDKYRVKLEENFKNSVASFIKRSLAETVLKAEKRFVYRCLYEGMEPMESMRTYIKDHYFWPVGALKNDFVEDGSEKVPLQDLFPDEILVQHIYCYIQFLNQKIEDLKKKEQNPYGTNPPTSAGKGSNESRKQHKRFVMNT